MIYSPFLLSTLPLSSCPPWLIVSVYHPSSVSLSAFHCLIRLALKSITDTLAFGEGEEYRWSCIDQESKTHKCSFMHTCTRSWNIKCNSGIQLSLMSSESWNATRIPCLNNFLLRVGQFLFVQTFCIFVFVSFEKPATLWAHIVIKKVIYSLSPTKNPKLQCTLRNFLTSI